MDQDRRSDLIDLIEGLQLEIGLVTETWSDILASPVPREPGALADHIAQLRQAAHDIVALTEGVEVLHRRSSDETR